MLFLRKTKEEQRAETVFPSLIDALSAQETTLIWITHASSCLWCFALLEKRNLWKSKCNVSATLCSGSTRLASSH